MSCNRTSSSPHPQTQTQANLLKGSTWASSTNRGLAAQRWNTEHREAKVYRAQSDNTSFSLNVDTSNLPSYNTRGGHYITIKPFLFRLTFPFISFIGYYSYSLCVWDLKYPLHPPIYYLLVLHSRHAFVQFYARRCTPPFTRIWSLLSL